MPSAFNAFPTSRPLPPDDVDVDIEETDPESSDSEDVTEDEDGVELTPALDAAILRTLGMIRRKEGVYGNEQVLQEQLKASSAKAHGLHLPEPKTKEKPFRLQDHQRAHLLSTVAKPSTSSAAHEEPEPLTNVQSERLLRQEALEAFKSFGADESEGEEEDGFLKKRVKSEHELKEEEAAYRKFLLESGGGEEEVRKVLGLQPKNSIVEEEEDMEEGESDDGEVIDGAEQEQVQASTQSGSSKPQRARQSNDDFLMNYILNRGWIDRSEEHVPTYDEVVAIKPKAAAPETPAGPWGTLDEDEDFEDKAEEFETAYNFRFEEPGAAEIPSHPRQIATLVRRPDDARKTKRAARAERKAAEKAQREESTRALKGEKRREMERQIAVLKRETSAKGADWTKIEEMLEGEWDEAKFESALQSMYEADGEDDEKPTWDDDDDEGMPDFGAQAEDAKMYPDMDDEEAPINMDADFIAVDESKAKKRRDRKGKAKAEREPEAKEDEEGLTVQQKAAKVKDAMDEYRKLDHEDMIGDLPTRFKYTPSAKTAYGLTPAEILLATDAELNALVGIKHMAPYRHGGLGNAGKGMGQRVRALKETLAERKWGEEVPDESTLAKQKQKQAQRPRDSGYAARSGDGEPKAGKRKGKKERTRAKLAEGESAAPARAVEAPKASTPVKRKAEVAAAPAETAANIIEGDGEGRKRKRKKKAHAQ